VMVFALSFVAAGRIQDKFGPFYCSLAGGILVSLGFFLCSYTTSLTYLFICFGVIGGLGNGFGYATPIPVMAKWFPDKRGLAVGLAQVRHGSPVFNYFEPQSENNLYACNAGFEKCDVV
jgi:MFS transporter, OFA family, oxalate/formate antiporter